jgi:hypothetical protein
LRKKVEILYTAYNDLKSVGQNAGRAKPEVSGATACKEQG